MRVARTMIGGLGLILAIDFAATALLAQGGRFSEHLDVLANLAPFWLAGSVVAGVLSLAGRGVFRRLGVCLALVGVLATAVLMTPEYLRSAGPTAPLGSPGEIKVIQLNAWRGAKQLDRIVDWLQAENPDVLFVEEATPALRDRIRARTGWAVAGALSDDMIFTHQHYLIMHRPPPSPGWTLSWVNATYANASGPMELVVTHTWWPTDRRQPAQTSDLRQVVAGLPRDRMILGGDFNSTPWSFQRRREDAGLGLIRRDRAVATWPTGHAGPWRWLAPIPFLAIDHIYAGPGWATTSVRRGPRLGSDHYPLVVTLAPVAAR
jgi:endonuclease/exonuclease/phosphatase (EEP) superfamily protein YafD